MQTIPAKVLERLTLYHSLLLEYINRGVKTISSPQVAQRLGIDDSQVRKDFKLLNNAGRCKVGYIVADLKESIEKTLGFGKTKKAFVIGAGHLGLALAKFSDFADYGLNIVALFDVNPQKIDTSVNQKNIYHISRLCEMSKRENVDMGILTVPCACAQETADFLIESGFKYIWNFTQTILQVPPEIKVKNENLVASFLRFACSAFDYAGNEESV